MNMNKIMLSLRAIRARAYVRIVGGNRELSWLVTEAVLPVISLAAYIFIYRSLGADPAYEGLVVLGGAMIPFWISVLWQMASQFYWEKEMGNLDLFMASPMHPIALLFGMAVGGIFMSLVRTSMVLLIGLVFFEVQLQITHPWLMALIFFLTMTALFSLGMAMSSIYFMVGRVGIKFNMILMEPVYFLSGLFFPANKFGKVMLTIAAMIPLTLGLDGIRQLALVDGGKLGFLSPWTEAALLLVMTVLFTYGAIHLLTYMEDKGKRRGTMTLRWQ